MLLSDIEIRQLCTKIDRPMIEPFYQFHPYKEERLPTGTISYGLTCAGYDLRLAPEVLVFNNAYGDEVDPKRFADQVYLERMFVKRTWVEGDPPFTIPANGYILGRSFEYLRIPRNLKARCVGKSTYARSGILINTTPLEPGWEGHLTIEIGNACPCPARVHPMEGIAQLEFEILNRQCLYSYAERAGKYQGQTGVTPAKVL